MTTQKSAPRRGAPLAIAVSGLAATLVAAAGVWQLTTASYADEGPQRTSLTQTIDGGSAYLLDCVGAPETRPTQYVLTCADANAQLTNVSWNRWGGAKATGTGTFVANTCEPDCARGRDASYPVEITADRLDPEGSAAAYRRIVLTYPDQAPPSAIDGREVFELPVLPQP